MIWINIDRHKFLNVNHLAFVIIKLKVTNKCDDKIKSIRMRLALLYEKIKFSTISIMQV